MGLDLDFQRRDKLVWYGDGGEAALIKMKEEQNLETGHAEVLIEVLPTVLTAKRHNLYSRMTPDRTIIQAYPKSVVHPLYDALVGTKEHSRLFIDTDILANMTTPIVMSRAALHNQILYLESCLYDLQRKLAHARHVAVETFIDTKRVQREQALIADIVGARRPDKDEDEEEST